MEKETIEQAIDSLLASKDFQALSEWTKTNLFDVLKLSLHEIRHSNMLAWLMDPHGNHGLNDSFLKNWFSYSTPLKNLAQLDCTNFTVKTENSNVVNDKQGRIDILLISENPKIVICIENKINSSEHDSQLERYKSNISTRYPGYLQYFVYLTLNKEKPSIPEWIAMSYDGVYDSVLSCMKELISNLDPETATILKHYQRTLEKMMPDYGRLAELQKKVLSTSELKPSFNTIRSILNTPEIEYIPNQIRSIIEHKEILDIGIPSQTQQYAMEIQKWLEDKKREGIISEYNTQSAWIGFTTPGLETYFRGHDLFKFKHPFSRVAYQIRNSLGLEDESLRDFSLYFYFKNLDGDELRFYRQQFKKLCRLYGTDGERIGQSILVRNFAKDDSFELGNSTLLDFPARLKEYLDRKIKEVLKFEEQYLKNEGN